jgi:hypothetical protein
VAGKRRYKVTLTDEERDLLRTMLSSGKAAARKLNHARLLLYADEAADGLRRTDQDIAATLGDRSADGGTGAATLRGGGAGFGLGSAPPTPWSLQGRSTR